MSNKHIKSFERPCPGCGTVFSRRRVVFCSHECAKKNLRERYNSVVLAYNNNPKRCLQCDVAIPYDKRVNDFCSGSCSQTKINGSRGVQKTLEQRQHLRERAKENYAAMSDGDKLAWKEVMKNANVARRKERTCLVCGGRFFLKNTKTCSRACYRVLCQQNNATKKGTGRGKSGYYKGLYCNSTYELAFVIWATDWGLPIVRSEKRIEYTFRGKKKLYFPDFEIANCVYEIKGREGPGTKAKAVAAAKIGRYVFIGKNKMVPYLDYVRLKFGAKVESIYPQLYGTKPKYEYVCGFCGVTFSRIERKRGEIPYCSRICSGKAAAARNHMEPLAGVQPAMFESEGPAPLAPRR